MYISVNDAAAKFGLSKRRVQLLCEQGRINGASMISGVWVIPEAVEKPTDGRRRKTAHDPTTSFVSPQKVLTVEDVSRTLSVSKATVKNWIRLGKIMPSMGNQLFDAGYIDEFVDKLRSESDARLKRRRNKTNATGKFLYKGYASSVHNQQLASDLLDLGIISEERELLVVLANFAAQLYYQSRKIQYTDNNVLTRFLFQEHADDFHLLVKDLIGDCIITPSLIKKLSPALSKNILFAKGEDSLGLVYISLRDIAQRKSSGAYYTPEKVVDELIDRLRENDPDLSEKAICDPCCGTGNFLIRLCGHGMNCSRLYGQDLDPVSVRLARINLALLAPDMSASDIRSRIIEGNAYFETFAHQFDVIVGNPPWGGVFSDEDVARCRKLFKTAAGKSLESYDLFVEKALSMLGPQGVLAFVLPEALLSVAAHDAVRRLMIDTCSFRFVDYLGNVFPGVQCPSIILGITPDGRKTTVGCRVSSGSKTFVISESRAFPDGMLPLNISDEENECLNAIEGIENAAYLKGNARFALGIVTGNNKEFITPQKQSDNEVILKGSDIRRYGVKTSGNYIRFQPEAFQQTAPVGMYRAKEKLLYRFICEVPVFAYDDQQRLSLNSCNIVIPEIDGLAMKYVLAVLNSSVAAYFISKRFNSVKLLRSHIEKMPIPVVPMDVQAGIIKKVDRMMHSSEDVDALYKDLDSDVMALYGLTGSRVQTIHNALKGRNLFLND